MFFQSVAYSYITWAIPGPLMTLRGPINVVVLQKYTCNSNFGRRPDFVMPKELKFLDVHKFFE